MFGPELPGLDRDAIRDWYNGYRWLGEEVYNPFDILSLFRRRKFGAYWFETGTPAFLLDTLFRRRVSSVELDGMVGSGDILSAFDMDDWRPRRSSFQTGYPHPHRRIGSQRGAALPAGLSQPRSAAEPEPEPAALPGQGRDAPDGEQRPAGRIAREERLRGAREAVPGFFASIPYEWYTNNDIADYEGYHASVFYSYFAALGLDITLEDSTGHGRLDMAVRFGGNVYLFEFKVVELEPEGAALAQLRERDYATKYRGGGGEVFPVGVEFSRETRNVVGFGVG